MIIENAAIRIISIVGGGFDKKGRPMQVTEELTQKIPCNRQTISQDKKGRSEDNAYEQVSYKILVDKDTFENVAFELENFQEIILYNVKDKEVGKFKVQSLRYMDEVNAVQFYV